MTALLAIFHKDGPAAEPTQVFDGMRIGRSVGNSLQIQDITVSAFHATVHRSGNDWFIADAGSNNGTEVAGGKLLRKGEAAALRANMHLKVGNVELSVVALQEPSADLEASIHNTIGADVTMPPNSAPNINSAVSTGGWMTEPSPPVESDSPKSGQAQRPVPEYSSGTIPSNGGALGDSMGIQTIEANNDLDQTYAVLGTLETLDARLLVLNEAYMRPFSVREPVFSIGRSRKLSCTIENGGVSSDHASIKYDSASATFAVEDKKSQNGTWVNRAPARHGYPVPLEPDALIRIGPIEAIFRCSKDAAGRDIPEEFDDSIAQSLVLGHRLDKRALAEARKNIQGGNQRLGDELLLQGHVSPSDWADQARQRRLVNPISASNSGNSFTKWAVAMAVLLAVAAAVLYKSGLLPILGNSSPL